MVRMTRAVVERLAGQTPCLCGDIDTWHRECYAGKTDAETQKALSVAYAIARKKLQERFGEKARAVIGRVIG